MAQVKFLKIANNVPTQHDTAADDLTVNSLTLTGGALDMATGAINNSGNISFNAVTDTLAGIQNQNLVDKTAAESITGSWDFGGATFLEIPNSAAPVVDAAGKIAIDTTITDHPGLLKFFGTEEMVGVALPIANLTAVDGAVVAYNATNNEFEMVAQGGTNYNIETYTNGNAGALAKGDVVYMTSTNDEVDLADSSLIAPSDVVVGLVNDASINAAASGTIHTARGKVITGVLTAATAGAVYYLADQAGSAVSGSTLTTTAPSGGPALVKIGFAKNATDLVFDPEFIADTTA